MVQRSRSTVLDEPDDVEILWGYPAAVMIEAGVQRLIARLDTEWRRYPTVAEIDEHIYGGTPAPETIEGIIYAAHVFREDGGRYPTPAEVLAGLLLVDAEMALYTYIANDIHRRLGGVGRAQQQRRVPAPDSRG